MVTPTEAFSGAASEASPATGEADGEAAETAARRSQARDQARGGSAGGSQVPGFEPWKPQPSSAARGDRQVGLPPGAGYQVVPEDGAATKGVHFRCARSISL